MLREAGIGIGGKEKQLTIVGTPFQRRFKDVEGTRHLVELAMRRKQGRGWGMGKLSETLKTFGQKLQRILCPLEITGRREIGVRVELAFFSQTRGETIQLHGIGEPSLHPEKVRLQM